MSLPDIAGLVALPEATLRALGRRLAGLGLTLERVSPVVAAVAPLAPPLRRPIRRFHLRRVEGPVGHAMRLLLFSEPVTEAEARAALGELLEPLLAAGLVARGEDGAVSSPFVLSVVDDLYVLCDDLSRGGEAVMGLGDLTARLCRAAVPEAPVGRALDLGCGAGTAALVLSRFAREVVATDINPRAVALGKVNAAINGVTNVSFRAGDLFAPVEGEVFDLIVSQPPFVPRPEGASGVTLLYGGARGDELAMRLLREVGPRLAPGGRAVVAAEWPALEEPEGAGASTVEARVREALGSQALNVLVLRCPPGSPDEHAAAYAAATHPLLDAAFEREAEARREHLGRLGIRGLTLAFTVLERAAEAPGWTYALGVGPAARIDVTSRKVGRLLAARALVGDRERLLAATLRVPEGTVIAEEQVGVGAEQPSSLTARFSEAALIEPLNLTPDLLFLLTFLHEAPSVRAGIARFAEEHGAPVEQVEAQLLRHTEEVLLAGMLEVA